MAIDSSALDSLMEKAGLGERAKKKLRAANTPAGASDDAPASRGHGAPAPAARSAGSL